MSQEDSELAAMAQVLRVLEGLGDGEARQRVLNWVSKRLGMSDALGATAHRHGPGVEGRQGGEGRGSPGASLRDGTVNAVALKLGAESCRKLLLVAAAFLSLYRERERFTRKDLIACAKEARAWRSDYTSQTSVNINRMCDADELIEKSKDSYSLSHKKLTELEAKLGA